MAKDPSKTEKATPKRRDDARKKGQVAISKEVSSVAVLLSSFLVFYFAGSYMFHHTLVMSRRYFSTSTFYTLTKPTAYAFLINGMLTFTKVIAPLLLVILVVAVASCVMQIGFFYASEALEIGR